MLLLLLHPYKGAKPVHVMVAAADKLAEWAMDVNVDVQTKDELASLPRRLTKWWTKSRSQAHAIEQRRYDFSVDVQPLGERDARRAAQHGALEPRRSRASTTRRQMLPSARSSWPPGPKACRRARILRPAPSSSSRQPSTRWMSRRKL